MRKRLFIPKEKLCLFLSVLLLLITGCGYHFPGQTNPYSAEIKTIAIPVLVNQTSEAGFENYVTNQLVFQFSSRKKLKVVDSKDADVIIRGKIISVGVADVAFTSSYSGVQRRVTVTMSGMLETRDARILWQDGNISREETYKVDSNPIITEDNKQTALRKIAADLAEMVHVRIFEDF